MTALVQSATALTTIVDIEIYDPGVNQVYQVWFENQAYAAGQQRSYPVSWQVPTGVVVGTYSSIFIAAPIVLWWNRARGGSASTLRREVTQKAAAAAGPAGS